MVPFMFTRVISGRHSVQILAVIRRQSPFQCFHSQVNTNQLCANTCKDHRNTINGPTIFYKGFTQSMIIQRQHKILFSQIRMINIAGDESLRLARQHNSRPRGNGDQESPRSSKRRSILAYMFALLPVATFCLGTWQIFRLQWKLDLISKLENLVKSSPVDMPENLVDLQEQEYLKVRLSGHFDLNSEAVFIFPRPVLQEATKSESANSGLFSTSKSSNIGALMIVPFVVTENRLVDAYNQLLIEAGHTDSLSDKQPFRILVNVGWVPRETMEKVNRSAGGLKTNESISQQELELIGVIRKTEKREPFGPKKDANYGYANRRNIDKIAQQLDTAPIFLDAHLSYPISLSYFPQTITPIGSQTRVKLRNEHLSYIITWYSLTIILSYLWYKKIFRRRL